MNKLGLTIVAMGCTAVMAGDCVNIPPPTESDFTEWLEKDGFTTHVMPSSAERAGALIMIDTDKGTHQWIGDLESCGFGAWGKIRRPEGAFPEITGEGTFKFGINALASAAKLGNAEAGISIVRSAKLSVSSAGKESLDYYQISKIYLDKDTREQLNPECLRDLRTGNVRLIGTAAFVDEGTFEFFKDNGATAKLSAKEIVEEVKLDAGFEAKSDGKSGMKIDRRIYVGFKEAKKFPDPGNLGPDGQLVWEDATDEVRSVF